MNGVVNFYKEQGITSFKAVDILRRLFGVSRCGHLGTLDPMAEGVLPICLGYATRFADYLSSVDKEYIAQFKLGVVTDSFDITGSVLSENSSLKPDNETVAACVSAVIGNIDLTVPAFSAKKINGVRAYKLARKGVIEDAGIKPMTIYSNTLLSYEYPFGVIRVRCGKGTYIRSIISAIGERLGCGAVMSALIRSANGVFCSTESFKLQALEELKINGELEKAVISVTELLSWGKAVINDAAALHIANGISPEKSAYLHFPIEAEGDNFFINDTTGRLLAVATRQENSAVPLKVKMVLI